MPEEGRRGRGLSKSKLLSWLQCPKRLWLEVYKPEVVQFSRATQAVFGVGHSVGEVARRLHPNGVLVQSQDNLTTALDQTAEHIRAGTPILFESTFQFGGVLVRADILKKNGRGYEMREVKASSSVRDYQLQDAAIQTWVLRGAGIDLDATILQFIDTSFIYPGGEDYRGLFAENVVDQEIAPLTREVEKWVSEAQRTLAGTEPQRKTGKHCHEPFDCSCFAYCSSQEPLTEYPLTVLPHIWRRLQQLTDAGYNDVRDIPADALSSEIQERVRRVTVSGKSELADGARRVLQELPYPRYYFDFETIGFAVPIWVGTRPYQQIPFQWSCHIERPLTDLHHRSFVDASGEAPMEKVAGSMLKALGDSGPILAYNAGFEEHCIEQLALMLPAFADPLRRLKGRFVDLLPLTRENYYHPAMKGSWSLKAVLPTVAPDLSYDDLEDVKDGNDAQSAYFELISHSSTPMRKEALRKALERYCERDTLALVRLAIFLQSAATTTGSSNRHYRRWPKVEGVLT